MRSLSLVLRELAHRRLSSGLALLAITAAVALCVALQMTQEAAQRETRRNMRDLGFNVRVIPQAADPTDLYTRGYVEETMPAETIHRLAGHANLSYNHLVASLQQPIELAGRSWILSGLALELSPPGKKKPPMGHRIEPGTLYLGHAVAAAVGVATGERLTLLGEDFTVAKTLAETASIDDVTLFARLDDAQRLLGLEGRINEIKAIDCLCLTAESNPLAILRAELEKALPEARVLHLAPIANARAHQRGLAERYAAFIVPLVVLVCAVLVCALAVLNVRQRESEIGILRALGYGAGTLATLFLGKAGILGLLGGLAGYALGTTLALTAGPELFVLTARALGPRHELLAYALVLAPLFTMAASFLPAALAMTRDPARTLGRDG